MKAPMMNRLDCDKAQDTISAEALQTPSPALQPLPAAKLESNVCDATNHPRDKKQPAEVDARAYAEAVTNALSNEQEEIV